MKAKNILAGLMLIGFGSNVWAAAGDCPESNATMQVVKGERGGQSFCAIRSTDATKPAEILKDTTFYAQNLYILGSGLYFGDNEMTSESDAGKVKLTIEAGTKIMGQSEKAYLQINRGAQIFANGTKEAPVVFTTARPNNRTRGSWGGLIINGNAPVNGCPEDSTVTCELQGEGLTAYKYGGPNPSDNSGVLNYVVVEFAGNEITSENELNGIAFQGVGNGTEVDYIQVHMNADDGVEFFGGTVDVKHVVLTGNRDDSLDWTSGWQGSAQYVIIEQYADSANYGIEADNFSKRMNATPRSAPILANMTLIGSDLSQGAKGGSGILLRRGTGAHVLNSYITGFSSSCFDIDDAETFRNAKDGSPDNGNNPGVVFENVYFNCAQTFTPVEYMDKDQTQQEPWAIESFVMAQRGNVVKNLNLSGYTPEEGSNFVEKTNFSDVENTDYVGAVKNASDRWYEGWTTTVKN
jgi:hypothetical protein